MTFALISFIAGFLTVLAPCVLPLLPVILSGSVADTSNKLKPVIITASLAVSVVVFTLLLKVATVFINIPASFWQFISGGIILFFGVITLFPDSWERASARLNLKIMRSSNRMMASGMEKKSFWGDMVIGASLGPVFSSCSPTYFVILATVLPQGFLLGFLYLCIYAFGLSLSLLIIAYVGQKVMGKLGDVSNPHGIVKRTIGIIFLVVGIAIITGFSSTVETALIRNSSFDVTKVESNLLQASNKDATSTSGVGNQNDASIANPNTIELDAKAKELVYPRYKEIANPSGFVNTSPLKIADLVGKKVVLLDFMTYSCINCQRTFPYLKAWYEKYKDQGLEIVAIHTPEFAFEHKIENVEMAMKQFGLSFPVVLDNDYGTWNAYANQYWPHKYLIDIDGFIRYDHIGEGGYDETESQIKSLLMERAKRLGSSVDVKGEVSNSIVPKVVDTQSTETYFGAFRNRQFFGNGTQSKVYSDTFTLPKSFDSNYFYLGGSWGIEDQYIESKGDATLAFGYDSKDVYLVAESNGASISVDNAGISKSIIINGATLYNIVSNKSRQSGVFYLHVPKGVRLYCLTFG